MYTKVMQPNVAASVSMMPSLTWQFCSPFPYYFTRTKQQWQKMCMCPQSHYPISVWERADAVQVFMVHLHWQKGLSELPDIKSWSPAMNSVYVHDEV